MAADTITARRTEKDSGSTESGTGKPESPIIGKIYTAESTPTDAGGNPKDARGYEIAGNGAAPGSEIGVKRGRGRPPGTGTGKRTSAEKEIQVDLVTAIKGLGELAALVTQCPELLIGDADAKQIDKAITEYNKYTVTKLNPKHVALFQLVTVLSAVFIPKGWSVYRRYKKAKAEQIKNAQS